MQIKRLLFSTSYRVVLLYIVFYLVTMIGFIWLMFGIVGQEVENNVKTDIKNKTTRIIESFSAGPTNDFATFLQQYIDRADPLVSVFILKDSDGKTLASNYPQDVDLEPGWIQIGDIEDDDHDEEDSFLEYADFLTEYPHDEGYLGYVATIDGQTLLVAQTLERSAEIKDVFIRTAFIVFPLALLLAIGSGFLLARLIIRRIDTINDQCRTIRQSGDLSLRIPNEKPGDEYGLLISNINAMLANIDMAVKNVQEVSDDVAHDLRTPLTRLKYGLETGLMAQSAQADTLRDVINAALLETNNLLETFSAILRISQINTGLKKSKFQPVDLVALAGHVTEAYEPFAEKNDHTLRFKSDMKKCVINADKDMLTQLISNLLENALHHAGKTLDIVVSIGAFTDAVVLSVQDNGIGISQLEKKNIFKKFYRIDKSRTKKGNGLGLAMVKAIADLHEAELRVETAYPGARFSITFPMTAPKH